jgi:hypothetical protein
MRATCCAGYDYAHGWALTHGAKLGPYEIGAPGLHTKEGALPLAELRLGWAQN